MQQTEKPGVSVVQVYCRHGVATSMVFRWLTARKAPQLATLADRAAKSSRRSPPCTIWCSRRTA
ncbi:transposase-like protein [Bradyrhizobium sp. USDA 4509]